MPTTDDLYNAIATNNLDEVKSLIENEEGLSHSHAYNYSSPLMQAAESGNLEIVRYLLDRGYCCIDDGNDETWYSPLIVASENGHVEITELLLKHGADASRQYVKEIESDETYATCQEQGYPLTLAVENGQMEVVRLLLEHRADTECIKYSYDGQLSSKVTPLLLALQRKNFEMVELLLKYGADVDGECLISGETHTPLTYKIAVAKPDHVNWLLDHGADPLFKIDLDDMGKANSLMYAVRLGLTSKKKVDERYGIVNMLLKAGVDLSCSCEAWEGETILDRVLDSGDGRYIQLFGLQNIKNKIVVEEPEEETLIPELLEIRIGSDNSPTFKVILDEDMLIWQLFEPEGILRDTKLLPVKDRDWQRFWMLCDMAGVWYWDKSHTGPETIDGKIWNIRIGFKDKYACAAGSNAFPVDEDYPECDGYTPLFRKFLRAVKDLLHGLPFE